MSTNALMQVQGLGGVSLTINNAAMARKRELLDTAAMIERVDTDTMLEGAAAVMREISATLKEMESSRSAIKAPVLNIGRQIDALAKEYATELDAAKRRLGDMVTAYDAMRQKEREEAERKAREEQERILREQRAKLDAATTDDAANAVMEETAKAIDAVNKEKSAAMPYRPKGMQVRTTVKFEVVDAAAMLKARPDLFSPDESKIRAAIKLTRDIPGVRVWDEQKAIC